MEIAVLALGCFWGPEKKFSQIDGIIKTEVGYCGGNNPSTNYQEVCTGNTGHAEVVRLEYDPSIISYKKILETFFNIHDHYTLRHNQASLILLSQYYQYLKNKLKIK